MPHVAGEVETLQVFQRRIGQALGFAAEFLGAQQSVPTVVASPANVAASTALHDSFDSEMLVQLESELANQIGAIARIVLKRCVSRTTNRQELFKMLADEMGDPALGKKFLDWASARFTV